MAKRIALAGWTLAVALLWCVAPGAAAEPEKPAPPPHGLVIDKPGAWRLVTPYSTTSQCLGDPKTALCAVETIMGCMARRDNSLCRLATGDPNYMLFLPRTEPSIRFWRFRIVEYRRIRADRYVYYGRSRELEKVDDFRVTAAVDTCHGTSDGYDLCIGYGDRLTYSILLRPGPDEWHVAAFVGQKVRDTPDPSMSYK